MNDPSHIPAPSPSAPSSGRLPGALSGRRSDRLPTVQPTGRNLCMLSLLALGIAYGDIGTSPLYAIAECFNGENAVPAASAANVLGVLSLITWSLIVAVSVKYLGFVLRADNRGEGGVMSLSALVTKGRAPRTAHALTIIGLIGAAFLYSDGIITPAISVLSAIEGITVVSHAMSPFVLPITVGIIVLLFFFQRHGTASVGAVFGPIMVLYFSTIAALGLHSIMQDPSVLLAIDPRHAVRFFADNGGRGYLVLGAVFLVVTGCESLYADLGHLGRRPIRLAWFIVVLPALLLNYYGQGSLLLREPTVEHAYFQLAPAWGQLPLVALSTVAAVIASQALISGTFSVTAQVMQAGYFPRLAVQHTSAKAIGQIYVPAVNWTLMLACVGLVLAFGSATHLAAAYGVSISMTMLVTSLLFFFAARNVWGWPAPIAASVAGMFVIIDMAFIGANLLKILHGGWFPLLTSALIFTVMITWKSGRSWLGQRLKETALPLERFLGELDRNKPIRVPGTAVFMAGNPASTPGSLLHNLKHNKVLHQRVIILTVRTESIPYVAEDDRCELTERSHGFYSLTVHFGFKEDPNIPAVLADVQPGFTCKLLDTSYFLGRETILLSRASGWPAWRRRLFAWMSRNSLNASAFFSLPPNRVVELGMHVEI